jgi:hypothetical protein
MPTARRPACTGVRLSFATNHHLCFNPVTSWDTPESIEHGVSSGQPRYKCRISCGLDALWVELLGLEGCEGCSHGMADSPRPIPIWPMAWLSANIRALRGVSRLLDRGIGHKYSHHPSTRTGRAMLGRVIEPMLRARGAARRAPCAPASSRSASGRAPTTPAGRARGSGRPTPRPSAAGRGSARPARRARSPRRARRPRDHHGRLR